MHRSASSVPVRNAGCLIALARLDRLALLGELFSRALVPEPVLNECAAGAGLQVEALCARGHWLWDAAAHVALQAAEEGAT